MSCLALFAPPRLLPKEGDSGSPNVFPSGFLTPPPPSPSFPFLVLTLLPKGRKEPATLDGVVTVLTWISCWGNSSWENSGQFPWEHTHQSGYKGWGWHWSPPPRLPSRWSPAALSSSWWYLPSDSWCPGLWKVLPNVSWTFSGHTKVPKSMMAQRGNNLFFFALGAGLEALFPMAYGP